MILFFGVSLATVAAEAALCLQETHEPRHKVIPSPFKNIEEAGQEWGANHEANSPAFDGI